MSIQSMVNVTDLHLTSVVIISKKVVRNGICFEFRYGKIEIPLSEVLCTPRLSRVSEDLKPCCG